jgi:hypothetical protein
MSYFEKLSLALDGLWARYADALERGETIIIPGEFFDDILGDI